MPENRLQLTALLSRFAATAARTVGARHLEGEICEPRPLPPPKGQENRIRPAQTQGCGGETKFELPVTGTEGSDLKHPQGATVCAVDDMAYMFPRYGGNEPSI